jgi:hypothetical protein
MSLDEIELQTLIDSLKWKGSGEKGPHSYIVRTDVPVAWEKIAAFIDAHAYIKEYKGVKYKYANLNGYRYWHFQLILNRAKLLDVEDVNPT